MFRWSPAGVLLTITGVLLAVLALSGAGSSASAAIGTACGASTLATISRVDAMVATNIYSGELGDSEVQADLERVAGAADLLAAVGTNDRAATLQAVKRIVYHPFWHIVRLRVLDAGGRVLADFGGPDVIAPVSGELSLGGVTVGSFVMSVQDDVGFAKLERRFVGDPIAIYVNGRRVVKLGGAFPDLAPSSSSVTLDGAVHSALTETYNAFPTGTLSAVIAVPAPVPALTRLPCAGVAVDEVGRVAERIATLFHPLADNYPGFIGTTYAYTGAIVVVHVGRRAIGGTEGLGPASLPHSGTVSYLGRDWWVFSFAAVRPTTVYLLVAQT